MTPDQDPGIVPQAVERAKRSPDSPLVPAVDPTLRAEPVDATASPPNIERTSRRYLATSTAQAKMASMCICMTRQR